MVSRDFRAPAGACWSGGEGALLLLVGIICT